MTSIFSASTRTASTTSSALAGSTKSLKTADTFFVHCISSMKPRSIIHVAMTEACAIAISRAGDTSSMARPFLNSSVSLEVSPRTDICLSARPLRRWSCETALSVTSRASGSAMEEAFVSRAGRRSGRKGAASIGLSTSLDMLSIITADWRLVAVAFSRSPRRSKGTTIASAGLSTDWTKVTPAISCMISGTSFGLVIAVRILSVMCSMSLFPITSMADFIAAVEACFTCFLVSHMHAVSSGTTSGSAFPSCLGAVLLKVPIH
mmetsp:Transcript_1442/g.2065  ORF Transcript_1442/g.2065 Transcript_1442/m.2065 type:complete len:263 (+) Transcript_1442:2055-2843(+)